MLEISVTRGEGRHHNLNGVIDCVNILVNHWFNIIDFYIWEKSKKIHHVNK